MKKIFILFAFISLSALGYSQVIEQPKHEHQKLKPWKPSPQKAAMLSALCPGLGQIYNKKGWYYKLPIIYGVGGWLIWDASVNTKHYNDFKDAYRAKIDNDPTTEDIYDGKHPGKPLLTKESLKNYVDKYKYKREKSFLYLTLLYAANILEANVTAHLFDYDISEDLSMRIEPTIIPDYTNSFASNNIGIKCSFRF